MNRSSFSILTLSLTLIFALAACSSGDSDSEPAAESPAPSPQTEATPGGTVDIDARIQAYLDERGFTIEQAFSADLDPNPFLIPVIEQSANDAELVNVFQGDTQVATVVVFQLVPSVTADAALVDQIADEVPDRASEVDQVPSDDLPADVYAVGTTDAAGNTWVVATTGRGILVVVAGDPTTAGELLGIATIANVANTTD